MAVLYFDTETDGLGGFRPPTQRLVQLAWEYDGVAHSFLINDVASISPHVPHPHTVQDCAEKGVPFAHAFEAFMRDLRVCDTAVAHNMAFDRGVLENEQRVRGADAGELSRLLGRKGFCTMVSTTDLCMLPSKSKFGRGYKYPKLGELYFHLFRVEPGVDLHDAGNDTAVLKECHEALLERALVPRAVGVQ